MLIKVTALHVGNVALGLWRNLSKLVGVLLSVLLYRRSYTSVRVTLSEDWVNNATDTLVVLSPDFLLFLCLRVLWKVRKVVTLRLELLNGVNKLWNGSRDVRKFHDVSFRLPNKLSKVSKIIRSISKLGKNSTGK